MLRLVASAACVLSVSGCLLLEPECREAVFEPAHVIDFDSDLEGFTVAAEKHDGTPLADDGTWSVAQGSERLACGTGSLAFTFTATESRNTAYVEKVFDMDTSQGFYLHTTFDFGTLDIAGAQGWTWEVSARTAEPFDSEEGVKKWNGGSTGKDDGDPGWRWVRRDTTFNLEPSASNKVWLRLGIRAGGTETPRNRKYYIDHWQVSAPEPR